MTVIPNSINQWQHRNIFQVLSSMGNPVPERNCKRDMSQFWPLVVGPWQSCERWIQAREIAFGSGTTCSDLKPHYRALSSSSWQTIWEWGWYSPEPRQGKDSTVRTRHLWTFEANKGFVLLKEGAESKIIIWPSKVDTNAFEHRGGSYLIYLENESGLSACHSA